MKLIFTLLLSIITITASSQALTFEEVQNAERSRDIPKDFSEYRAENGQVFKAGDFIKIGSPSSNSEVFQFIILTDGWSTTERVGLGAQDWEAEIVKFKVAGTRRAGFDILAVCKSQIGILRYWITIDKAIVNGEIRTSILSRDEAIEQLKESKDLLDLEMMSQKKYDSLKNVLAPIIKGGN